MSEDPLPPISLAELADLDAQYVPFPPFSEWPNEVVRDDLWARDKKQLDLVSREASDEDLERAQEIALRTAAFDTGAIEGLYPTDRGLTFTVATQASAWEQEVKERDDNALAHFQAQLDAFELVLDLATSHFPKMTQSWVRRLHEVVTAAQDTYVVFTPIGRQERTLPKGKYKTDPNHVRTPSGGVHAYAPVESTQPEMQRLLDELDTDAFREAHPVLQASYVHYAVAAIHPFADGNGRVARAMASTYTYRSARIPLLVLAHQRDRYLSVLAEADAGNRESFVSFIGSVGRDAMEMVTERLRAARAPQPEAVLDQFKEMYLAQGNLSHQQIDQLANGFLDDTLNAVQEEISSLQVPEGVDIQWVGGQGGNQPAIPSGFRSVVDPGPRYIQLSLSAAPPASARLRVILDILVSTQTDTSTTILMRVRGSDDPIIFGQSDLSPQMSSAARLRIESFLRRIIGEALARLLEKGRNNLRASGY